MLNIKSCKYIHTHEFCLPNEILVTIPLRDRNLYEERKKNLEVEKIEKNNFREKYFGK